MVEFVVREGPMFEAMIMNKELNNPMYRWAHFSNFKCLQQKQMAVWVRKLSTAWKSYQGSLRYQDSDSGKSNHSKQSIRILSNFIAIMPTCSLFHFLLELIPKDTLQAQRKRKKNCCHLFISLTKPEIRQLHIVVKQWWQRSVPKSVIQVQICCFLVAYASMTS